MKWITSIQINGILQQLVAVEENTKFAFTLHGEETEISSNDSLAAGGEWLSAKNPPNHGYLRELSCGEKAAQVAKLKEDREGRKIKTWSALSPYFSILNAAIVPTNDQIPGLRLALFVLRIKGLCPNISAHIPSTTNIGKLNCCLNITSLYSE